MSDQQPVSPPKTIKKAPPPSSRSGFGGGPSTQQTIELAPRTELAPTFKHKAESWMVAVVDRALRAGMPLAQTAGLIGVTRKTFSKWLALGQDEKCTDPVLVEFAVAVEKARSEAALKGVQLMNMHAAVDWKCQLELLRAQDPDTWSAQTRSKVDVTHHDGSDQRDLSGLTDEELEELAALEAKIEHKRLPA